MHLAPIAPSAWGSAPLALLHRECFPEDPWDSQSIAQITRLAGVFGWIAWQDDVPTGFVLARDLAGESEILSLGVVPAWRRTGIGSALLLSACRAADTTVLEVAVDNLAARAFYTGHGFRQVGLRPRYYRRGGQLVDALILRRRLSPAFPAARCCW